LPAAADAFEREWCELDTGQFRIITDRSRQDAEDMAWRMRLFRPIAESYLPGTPNVRELPLRVVVFGNTRDYRRAIAGADVAGYMLPSLNENLMVVGPDPRARGEHEALLHEYVHYLLRTRTDIHLPAWFDEGLAGMLSTAEIAADRVVIGGLPAADLKTAIDDGRLRPGQVIESDHLWRWQGSRLRAFYAWSWVLAHRLLLGQEAGLPDLRPALAAYLGEEHTSLLAALDLSSAALERSLTRYLARRTPQSVHAVEALADDVETPRFRCLDDNEKAIEIGLAILPHNPDAAVRRLRKRLDVDPQVADLWVALSLAEEALGDREAAVASARAALERRPDDVSASVRLASALAMGCIFTVSIECRGHWQEAVPLLRQALRQDPARQDAIFMLGLAYLYSGRPGDALNYLRIAYRRQPWAGHINFYLGEAFRLTGDRRRAVEHLERTQAWSPVPLWRRLAEAALAELDAPPD
jgi:tetratricopeptide (TPR) repeat protein